MTAPSEDWRSLVDQLATIEETGPRPSGQANESTSDAKIRARLWSIALGALDGGPSRPAALQDIRETLQDHWAELSPAELRAVLARAEELRPQLRRELDLPNTLLVGDQPEIYAEADRARAEAEFRLALVLPTIALVVVLIVVGTPRWAFGFFAPAALLFTGLAKQDEARTFILNSIESGKTPSPAARRFSEHMTQRLGLNDHQERKGALVQDDNAAAMGRTSSTEHAPPHDK
jgi:hypothetical protein